VDAGDCESPSNAETLGEDDGYGDSDEELLNLEGLTAWVGGTSQLLFHAMEHQRVAVAASPLEKPSAWEGTRFSRLGSTGGSSSARASRDGDDNDGDLNIDELLNMAPSYLLENEEEADFNQEPLQTEQEVPPPQQQRRYAHCSLSFLMTLTRPSKHFAI